MKLTKVVNMIHPGKKIIEEIRNRNWTQKQFAVFVGKKNSEVNELIKGKRNITIQRDLILSEIFGTPEKYWINMQIDYDYEIAKKQREEEKKKESGFEIVKNSEEIYENGKQLGLEDQTNNIGSDQKQNIIEEKDEKINLNTQTQENIVEVEKKDKAESEQDQVNIEDKESEEYIEKRKELKKIFRDF